MTRYLTAIIILPMVFRRLSRLVIVIGVLVLVLAGSVALPASTYQRASFFARAYGFDFFRWTLDALAMKLEQAVLNTGSYLQPEMRPEIVLEYLELQRLINQKEAELSEIYANPEIAEPLAASVGLRETLNQLYDYRSRLQPLAEEVLQEQVSEIAASEDLALGGQTLPPVLYHISPPPYALIVSPRDVIRQDADVPVSPEMTLEEINALEDQVDQKLDVSSLVTRVGGIGLYPTMVSPTTDINWLAEVVAHEWVHNYLILRPMGINYLTTPELRIINETTASIAGKELGQAVIARYYPAYLPPPAQPTPTTGSQKSTPEPQPTLEPPAFDFRAEMHETRLEVDRLLAEGEIEQAEEYMEQRRRVFWENGYRIRKLNQAYFAFHGAYADRPGGAAGTFEDPVGSAVRTLRANSTSLADFINRISWMWSYEQLQRAVDQE